MYKCTNEKTEGRFEYIEGIVYALASPSYTHQHIITQLFGELYNYFKDKECEPYVAPFNIHLEKSNTKNIVQPDLFVMCDKENIRDDKYYGIPTLIIEVISPSTRNNDLIKKLNLYVNSGVKEYVIVDPKNKNIIHWNFNNFEVDKCNTINKDEVFTSNIYKGLSFNLSNIF